MARLAAALPKNTSVTTFWCCFHFIYDQKSLCDGWKHCFERNNNFETV
jgi:hypothetical protein